MSISSPLPGLPGGKPAAMPCPHLSDDRLCALYGRSERPRVCVDLRAREDLCGSSAAEAMALIEAMEAVTRPGPER
jgi:uncharacterized protein